MDTLARLAPHETLLGALARGFRASWQTIVLLAAINTAVAAAASTMDPRPFWHPLVSIQVMGFAIAYCVNVAAPWERRSPIIRLVVACAFGSVLGIALTVLLKGYTSDYVSGQWTRLAWSCFSGFLGGVTISFAFLFKFHESRANAALHKAEAERHLLSRQAVEAELKLMQAQVEPHFLFNTLASVQFLTETDPKEANRLLGHLIDYLRAALPQMRASSTTLGREFGFLYSYLSILKMRMGDRLNFRVEKPSDQLAGHPVPPNMLISLVENAIKHGLEPAPAGGSITVSAERVRDELVISVVDTGHGADEAAAASGHGIGLSNLRERLAALYGARGRFALTADAPQGTRATLSIPFES